MSCRYVRNDLSQSWNRYKILKLVKGTVFAVGRDGDVRSFTVEQWNCLDRKEPIPDKKLMLLKRDEALFILGEGGS
jgi:hypothetical protein